MAILNDAVSLTLLDCAGGIIGERRAVMPSMVRKATLERLRTFRDELLEHGTVDPKRVLGIGVGISASFSGQGGQMVGPPALEDWTLVEIAR